MFYKLIFRVVVISAVCSLIISCNSAKVKKKDTTDETNLQPQKTTVNPAKEKFEITQQLEKFQSLYLQNNKYAIPQLMALFSSDKNIEVIYGCAEKPHTIGWCRGIDEIKNMMIKDTECWSHIEINYDETLVDFDKDAAWVSTVGEAELTPQYLEKFKKFTEDITKSIEDEAQINSSIAPSVLKIMMDILYVKSKEGKLELPFVLTIVYSKEKGQWLIRQMHFSYPIDPRGLDDISVIKEL